MRKHYLAHQHNSRCPWTRFHHALLCVLHPAALGWMKRETNVFEKTDAAWTEQAVVTHVQTSCEAEG